MRLPSNEVGISDILNYRACPQRFAFGMRRHVPLPERFQLFPGERDEPPEAESYASAYGHAVHDAVQVVEETACSDEDAIDAVWPVYQHWLEPGDRDRMRTDLTTYRERTATGFKLIGAELEVRVPLFVHNGEQIYFRGRIDVLYQHIHNHGYFVSRDYKSSRWPRSEAEIQGDLQQWSYNWAIHEMFPECETLVQIYDQFRFGAVPIRKSDTQRRQIKEWLVAQVKAMLDDEVLKPTSNDMCHFCPIMMDCRVTHRAADYWVNRLGALAPERKEGRKVVVQLTSGDDAGFEMYTEILPQVKKASKVMERFAAEVESTLKEMPEDRREELGYSLARPRSLDTFDADAKRQLMAELGDDFIHLVRISKTDVEDFFGAGTPEAERVVSLATKKQSAPSLKRNRG